jgi:hypothetical protein
MLKFFAGIFYIVTMVMWLLGIIMHIWTVIIAFNVHGLISAAISFFLPLISQIYWGYKVWIHIGIDSPYLQWLVVLFSTWVISKIVGFILNLLNSKTENYEA